MSRVKVKITWEDGTSEVFNDIPAAMDEAKVRAAFEEKFKKKIKTYEKLGPTIVPIPGSQDDRDSSSQTPPAKDAKPTATPAGQRDEEPDYRYKFPDKFTPKNMRRNKWGELIYE